MSLVNNIKSLSDIVEQYEAFILDQWGVMHDGFKGYPDAISCIKKLIELDKKLIIISNSSKRKKTTIKKLPKLGFNPNNFIEVMTSGEMIWQCLYTRTDPLIKKLSKNCYYLSDLKNKDELEFKDGLNFNFVKDINKADFILACSINKNYTTLDYVPLIKQAIENNILFICANPDFETIETSSINSNICMGTIAKLYNDLGGDVFMLGKPNTKIYLEATKNIKEIKKSKILAIGDSVHHDIQGAINFGIDSLLISSGLHSLEFDNENPKWKANTKKMLKYEKTPTFLCSKFKF